MARASLRFALAVVAVVLFATMCPRPAHAVDDPTLVWWTYETDHFRVTYPEPIDPVARRIAILAETIHARLSNEMHFAPDEKTEILLTDDSEAANGVASPVPYDNIHLYTTAPPEFSTLGDYDDWILGLVTHEYTHILHTGNISGAAAVANRIIGKTLAPNSAQPRWILEGLAVVEESQNTTAGRVRSTLFDMQLRADVLENNFARIDQISGDAQRWPYGNLWYLYGSRFLRWIIDVYGRDTFPAISADYGATTIPFGINRAVRRVTGRTYEELYDAWHADLSAHYKEQVAAADKLGRIEGVRITYHGHDVLYPRFVPTRGLPIPKVGAAPGDDELIYWREEGNDTTGLYRMSLGDPTRAGKRDERLFVRTSAESSLTFSPEGGIVFSDSVPYRNIYTRYDLFQLPPGADSVKGTESERKRLTEGWRASEPDLSPDGRHLAFTVNSVATRFLSIADVHDDGSLGPRHVLVPSARFEQAYTPRFSPDGKTIVYSVWTEGGFRDLRLVDVATGKFTQVTHDRSLDMEPTWSPDGKTIYFASDRTGISNIYAFDVATKEMFLVTNVHNGAYTPAISNDGKKLVYTGYTHEGYDLFAMPLDRAKFLPAPAAPNDRPELFSERSDVRIEKHHYNPLPTFGPHSYTGSFGQGYYGDQAFTFKVSAGDIVGHHSLSASLTAEVHAPAPRWSLDYAYGGFPVNIGVGVARTVVPRNSGFRAGDVNVPWNEQITSLSSYVSLPVKSSYVDQAFSLSYSAQLYNGDLEVPTRVDPDSTTTTLPPHGLLSQVRASYTLSTVEGGIDSAGTIRGIALRLSASYAGQETASDSQLYSFDAGISGFVPMPWPGHQTLALRLAGATSGGDYSKRGLYFVGGYDLANVSFLDTLLNGTYDGAFVLRGYGANEFSGSEYLQSTIEYRAPVWVPNWGPSTLPVFLRRFDAAAFFDYGGAFDRLQIERARLFRRGDLLYLPDLHASIGAEIWMGLTLAHRVDFLFRLGYAYGFSSKVYPDGQPYFLAATTF